MLVGGCAKSDLKIKSCGQGGQKKKKRATKKGLSSPALSPLEAQALKKEKSRRKKRKEELKEEGDHKSSSAAPQKRKSPSAFWFKLLQEKANSGLFKRDVEDYLSGSNLSGVVVDEEFKRSSESYR